MEEVEKAVLLKMYDEHLIGPSNYTSIERVRSKIKWTRIASVFGIKKKFDNIARRLVSSGYLSDAGKSMAVLFLDKFGVDYVIGLLAENPDSIKELNAKLDAK